MSTTSQTSGAPAPASTAREDDDLLAWIRLSQANIPPRKLAVLLNKHGGRADRALSASPADYVEAGLTSSQRERLCRPPGAEAERTLETIRRTCVEIVTLWDESERSATCAYPQRLKELPDAPPLLYVRGRLSADDRFSLAVVGSRRATSYGLSIADRFSRDLSAHGLCIVSGGARGIDTRAHRSALAAGGRTVAVLGCGLDVAYPSENRALYDEMVESGRGALISEYPIGATPEPWHFPARNRLISGMTLGTLVIESPVDSGAMITANDAANAGREVFAVPGPIDSGRSSGCHRLIQEGAKLVQCADDILDELGVLRMEPEKTMALPVAAPQALQHQNVSADQQKVLDLLSLDPQHVDYLADRTRLAAATVIGVLTMLELRGLARRVPGNAFVRVL